MNNELTPDNIWQYRQNKPTLIVRDLARYASASDVYAVLLKRGVFKWLAARRDFIKLKNVWRDELTALYRSIENGAVRRNSPEHYKLKGRIEAIEECRAQVRSICHSPRWRAPDFDKGAARFLAELESD